MQHWISGWGASIIAQTAGQGGPSGWDDTKDRRHNAWTAKTRGGGACNAPQQSHIYPHSTLHPIANGPDHLLCRTSTALGLQAASHHYVYSLLRGVALGQGGPNSAPRHIDPHFGGLGQPGTNGQP